MNYQIVATLGPSSTDRATWEAMLAAGATTFRLNTAHMAWPALQVWIGRIDALLSARAPRPSLILDLQGSKWRLGQFPSGALIPGQSVTFVRAEASDRPDVLPVPHADFFLAAPASSGEIVLNDAKLRLRLEAVARDRLHARVRMGGEIAPRKGITYTDSSYRQESLSEADRAILLETRNLPGIRYALSYVRDAVEMANYRAEIGGSAFLIAKLERRPAVEEARGIAESADELWLCRGDLGAELGAAEMASAVFQFSGRVSELPLPVLLAGQVFEHLVEHSVPTRSEVCMLYEALRKGYAGLVLSDETAIGRDPIESCRMAAMFRT